MLKPTTFAPESSSQEIMVKFRNSLALSALICSLAALTLAPSLAMAQQAEAPASDTSDTAVPLSTQTTSQELPPDDDSAMYWAAMRDIYTVQKRAFTKEGRLSLTLYGGLIPNNIFEQFFPVGLRANYFLLENIGMELASSYAFRSKTGLEDILQDPKGIQAQQVLMGNSQVSHSNFAIMWSPFYGKSAMLGKYLHYFDLYLVAGAGLAISEIETDFNQSSSIEVKPEGVLGGGMAVFLTNHLGLRADFRQFVFERAGNLSGVSRPSEVSLGLSWYF